MTMGEIFVCGSQLWGVSRTIETVHATWGSICRKSLVLAVAVYHSRGDLRFMFVIPDVTVSIADRS